MTPIRKTTAILGWFPTTPATEREVLDMATARQIALRTRLRFHYWLTDCQPLSELTVEKLRRKMALIDPHDVMEAQHVEEVLSEHYGFTASVGPDGTRTWRIQELDEGRGAAVASIETTRARASVAGRASAARRAESAPRPALSQGAAGHEDF